LLEAAARFTTPSSIRASSEGPSMSIVEPRTSEVTIYQGDYLDRLRFLAQRFEEVVKAESKTARTLADVPESDGIADEYDALKAEAEKTAIRVRIRAIRRSQYREMADKHPPRTGDDVDPGIVLADSKMGVNEKDFRLVLVPAAIVEVSVGEKSTPWAEMSEDDREDFLDTITEADFELLFSHAFALVNSFGSAPKALKLPVSQTSPASAKS
jgi:hypothetical protein